MEFKQRFMLLLVLGLSFSLTIMVAQTSLYWSAVVAMFAVVLNYWVVLILVRKTVLTVGTTAPVE